MFELGRPLQSLPDLGLARLASRSGLRTRRLLRRRRRLPRGRGRGRRRDRQRLSRHSRARRGLAGGRRRDRRALRRPDSQVVVGHALAPLEIVGVGRPSARPRAVHTPAVDRSLPLRRQFLFILLTRDLLLRTQLGLAKMLPGKDLRVDRTQVVGVLVVQVLELDHRCFRCVPPHSPRRRRVPVRMAPRRVRVVSVHRVARVQGRVREALRHAAPNLCNPKKFN